MDDINENLEKMLGLPVNELTSDPSIARLLWYSLRVKDASDCEQALRRAIDHVNLIWKELTKEPLPSLQTCMDWIGTSATRFTAEVRLSSRAWIELDEVILEAAEAINALAYESRHRRRECASPPSKLSRLKEKPDPSDLSWINEKLPPRLDACVGRLENALARVQLLQQQAREELATLLRNATLAFAS